MIEIELDKDDSFSQDSEIITTEVGQTYTLTTEVLGIKGKPYSAYFGTDIVHSTNLDSDRRVIWLNDFSGMKKKVTLTIRAPTDGIRIHYRINKETKTRSECKYKLLPLDKVSIFKSKTEQQKDLMNFFEVRPKELSPEEELLLEKNLVWLFGSARSGTTWLGTELLTYNTHVMREPKLDLHLGILNSVRKNVFTELENNQDRLHYVFSFKYKNTWKFYLRKLILNRIYCQFNDLNKKIIVKEPSAGTLGFAIIAEFLPNSKIIWLLRDGRDVVDSQTDARTFGYAKGGRFAKNIPNVLSGKARTDFIRIRSRQWARLAEQMNKTFENHSPYLRLLIRYEELRKNTVEELDKIYQFLGIKIEKDVIEKIVTEFTFENIPQEEKGKGKQKRSATPGKWKENMSKEETNLVQEIMGETLRKLGYE